MLAFGAAGVIAAFSLSGYAYEQQLYMFNPVCGIASFLLVGIVAFSGPQAVLTRVLSLSPLAFLGEISYGIYLWHEAIHHVLFNEGVLSSSYIAGFLEIATCTIALATGTYYLVEKPALRLKNRWAVPRSAPPRPKGSKRPGHARRIRLREPANRATPTTSRAGAARSIAR
jgi:peptidoglycan/LPS O-acetylase OafA/YrhL